MRKLVGLALVLVLLVPLAAAAQEAPPTDEATLRIYGAYVREDRDKKEEVIARLQVIIDNLRASLAKCEKPKEEEKK